MLRNITWLGAASFAVKPIWFVFVTVLSAEVLGAEGYGVMTVSLSVAAIASAFTDLGMGPFSVREVARDRTTASLYLTNFLLVRSGLAIVALAGALGAGLLLGYRGPVFSALVFAGVYQMSLSLITYARSYFQAFEVLKYEAVSLVIEKVFVVGLGLALLYTTRSAAGTLGGMAVGMIVVCALTVGWIHRSMAPVVPALFSAAFVRQGLRRMMPFAMVTLFTVVYMRTDLIMIEQMRDAGEAGQYGLAFRILEALNLIPIIVATSTLFPRLSSLQHQGALEPFRQLVRKGLVALGFIGLATAAGITWLAPAAVDTVIRVRNLDPAFAASVPALQILVWTFPLASMNALLQAALIAFDNVRFLGAALIGGTVLNIALNFIVIPEYGILGASAATLVAELLLFILYGLRQRWMSTRSRQAHPATDLSSHR